jgi:uncharacterized protein (DUF1684 family)
MNDDLKRWQVRRHAELSGPDSWLGLIGLFWLEPGRNPVGSAAGSAVLLPAGPDWLGDLAWEGEAVSWQPAVGEPLALQTDRDGAPTVVEAGSLAFFIVEREGRLAARLRDRDWAARLPFAGIDCFPFAPAWRIEAQWQRLEPPLRMEVPNVSGELKEVEVSYRAVFEVDGQAVSLLPMSVGEREVFFVFRDRSSGKQTYGAGRFLKTRPAVDGRITLDFNRAFNPPCAFTPFATCPLPPPENWLPFAIPAGEMKWGKPAG